MEGEGGVYLHTLPCISLSIEQSLLMGELTVPHFQVASSGSFSSFLECLEPVFYSDSGIAGETKSLACKTGLPGCTEVASDLLAAPGGDDVVQEDGGWRQSGVMNMIYMILCL